MNPGGRTPAWLVVWGCHCHEVRADPALLPERCPGHGKPRIEAPEQLDVLDRYVDAHDCGDAAAGPCSGVAS